MSVHIRVATDLVRRFRQAFSLLQGYDEGFQVQALQQDQVGEWPLAEVREELAVLRTTLMAEGEATELFGQERGEALAALWGNLQATVFGAEAYPSVESRAAHLLYFVVKNHPFADGNKRSGAYLLVSYLNRQKRLNSDRGPVINPTGLAALTVLVAESRPENKDLLIELIIHMLAGKYHE